MSKCCKVVVIKNCYFTFFEFDIGRFSLSWIYGDNFICQVSEQFHKKNMLYYFMKLYYYNVYNIGQQRVGFAASKKPIVSHCICLVMIIQSQTVIIVF